MTKKNYEDIDEWVGRYKKIYKNSSSKVIEHNYYKNLKCMAIIDEIHVTPQIKSDLFYKYASKIRRRLYYESQALEEILRTRK